ncbi:lipid IV(A) 3-deoxy-D-manno-octulosonic acid transferase [Methylomonas sp. UP202]|uniref:lipid IV(A) 3-deoxy-D-manno-octulosonic acid transferase n=1 Tax=Methylomonas sp. UP202 TaxID=3040943 RepID=UPI002478FC2E|nr:lipid IV(A) 3-deoxy-D-manno-octulosonic acid transferase [Methylomonas sp. UP202]WGS84406.1 lipid IV(A) 3-deoxy-D-manno-octulosonic acid transferase [Methylomonas sp. UP202]
MRLIYTCLFGLLLPAILLRLYWRGMRAPAYRLRWRERLGFYRGPVRGGGIWFHAVSVGEAEAAFPLIQRLLSKFPQLPVLVTTTTPTGSARVAAVLGDRVEHVYLPYDLPWVVARFFGRFRPSLAVFMEKELWPNLFAECRARSVPIFLVNARLSARSARAYLKIPSLIGPVLACIDTIAVQTVEDGERFVEIGARPVQVRTVGNVKFDVTVDPNTLAEGKALKASAFAGRWVWIAASTHAGEEELLLAQYRRLKAAMPALLLMIVPRHPERFGVVQKLCETQGLRVLMRSSGMSCRTETDVYIGDSMGELKLLYAAADAAFVGGSLVEVGGHNVLEPAAIGTPVLFGPWMFNFQEIANRMLAVGAACQCADAEALGDAVSDLYRDRTSGRVLAERAEGFVQANRGATDGVVELLVAGLAETEAGRFLV